MTARHGSLACLLGATLFACLGALPPAEAAPKAERILLTLKGRAQGPIKGGVTTSGFEMAIAVTEFSRGTVSPRDAVSGLPTGQIQAKGITIHKLIDATSPRLMQALTANDVLTEGTLTFFQASGQGTSAPYLTIRLSNGRIVSIEQRMLNTQNPELARYAEYEEIAFMFERESPETPGATSGTGGTMRRPPKLP